MTDKDGVNMEAIAHWHSDHSSRYHGIQSPWWAFNHFFSALYLKDLDRAMDRSNAFYVRYMNDVLILFKSKRSYLKARKIIARILRSLKLMPSSRKTSHCALDKKGFHFLGIDDCLIRTKRWIQTQVKINVRTLRRAHDNLAHHHADAPAATQRYLRRWVNWWSFSHELNAINHLKTWAKVHPDLGRLALGVLLGSRLSHKLTHPGPH